MPNTPSSDEMERLCAHLRMHMARECHEAAATIERLSAELERALMNYETLENEIAVEIQKARDEIGADERQRIAFSYAEAAMRGVFYRIRATASPQAAPESTPAS